MMLIAQKVRLYPSAEQQQIISAQFGAARYIYNRSLALKKFAYKKYGITLSRKQLQDRLITLKQRHKWLKDADSQALQSALLHMDEAYKKFFKGGGFPKFKSKNHSRQSYQYPQRVKIDGDRIYLPKVGWVKAKGLRHELIGKIKTVTVSSEAYQYHASILIDIDAEPVRYKREPVGIDMGVSLVVADSNGNMIKPIDFERELVKLRRCHQVLSRKKKGSNNRQKAKMRLGKQNLRIANMRKDFLHKLSSGYIENQVIVEELKIKNMTKSAKGTEEKPGENVKAKSGLNRSILKNGWGMFFEMLEYKTNGNLIKVSPEYTSQTCNVCGHVSKENRKTQAKFVCTACGHTANSDVNAAKNIRDRGIHGSNASHQTAA